MKAVVFRGVAVVASCLSLVTSLICAQDEKNLPLIQQQADADEELFLVRVLENLYDSWPISAETPDAWVLASRDLRMEALKYHQHIEDKKLDRGLGQCFSNLIVNLDEYTRMLANINVIQEESLKQSKEDRLQSGSKAVMGSAGTVRMMNQYDNFSTDDKILGALVVGVGTWAVDAWRKAGERDRVMLAAVEADVLRVMEDIEDSLIEAQSTARELAKKRGWEWKEIGWDRSDIFREQVISLSQAEDKLGILQLYEGLARERPRDPFVRLEINTLRLMVGGAGSVGFGESGRDTYRCLALVPEDDVYDEYRRTFMWWAAVMMVIARDCEIREGVSVFGDSENGRMALDLCRKLIELSPSDVNGSLRGVLASALLNNNYLDEAMRVANSISALRKDDPEFNYIYACIMSRSKDAPSALKWLKQAINKGYCDIAWTRKDPRLQYLRETEANAFTDMLSIKFKWDVSDDWLWDDIHLENNSAFPLTGVSVSFSLHKAPTETQSASHEYVTLTCDHVGVGETYIWYDAVIGPVGQWDQNLCTLTLSCDQNK